MAEITTADGVRLHVEPEGEGDPVTVVAHGLTNSCMELAAFTPFARGTKVRMCLRGHGHSSVPPAGSYSFAHYASDVDAVASAYGATRALGTSLGAGAITRLVAEQPHRFERLVLLLPAALDRPIGGSPLFLRTAELLETMPLDQAIPAILAESGRERNYEENPGLREFDLLLWQDMNPIGVARAIREIVGDVAVPHPERLRAVRAPVLVIAREGDTIHPASVARALVSLFADAELVMLGSEADLMAAIPSLVERVARFLA